MCIVDVSVSRRTGLLGCFLGPRDLVFINGFEDDFWDSRDSIFINGF
jgi:hypothetical protein